MQKQLIITALLIVICSACSNRSNQQEYINIIDRVVGKKTRQICLEEDISLVGEGGAMMKSITMVSLTFNSFHEVDINEARRLCVRCVEELVEVINATEALQPHLSPYPFPSSKLDIGIMFRDKKKDSYFQYGCAYLGTGGVSLVFADNGYIYYASYNPKTKLLEPYYEETYEEALEMVNSRKVCNIAPAGHEK